MAAVYYYPSAAIRVCVDKNANTKISGRIFYAQLDADINFFDVGDLVLKIDDICNLRGFPDAFQSPRSFDSEKREIHRHCAVNASKNLPKEEFGVVKTMLVYVLSRRSSSWQGKVEWVGEDKSDKFNSALEFLRIISDNIISP